MFCRSDDQVLINAAGSDGRCNTIWYKAVFKGGVYEAGEAWGRSLGTDGPFPPVRAQASYFILRLKWKTMGASLLEQHPAVNCELAVAAIQKAKLSLVSQLCSGLLR